MESVTTCLPSVTHVCLLTAAKMPKIWSILPSISPVDTSYENCDVYAMNVPRKPCPVKICMSRKLLRKASPLLNKILKKPKSFLFLATETEVALYALISYVEGLELSIKDDYHALDVAEVAIRCEVEGLAQLAFDYAQNRPGLWRRMTNLYSRLNRVTETVY